MERLSPIHKKSKTIQPSSEELSKKLKRLRDEEKDEGNTIQPCVCVKLIFFLGSLLKKAKGLESPPLYYVSHVYDGPTDGQYSPTSPQYSPTSTPDDPRSPQYSPDQQHSDAEEEEEEEEEEEKPDEYERFFADGLPFNFDSKADSLLLDSSAKYSPALNIGMFSDMKRERNIFSRDIRSYKNGTFVFKNCSPWGDKAFLCNAVFQIKKKVFSADGEAYLVVLQDCDAKKEYYIKAAFFSGWMDVKALDEFCDVKGKK